MIAAERNEVLMLGRLRFDQPKTFADVAERDREIADISDRKRRGIDPPVRMIAVDQHAAGVPDRHRTEARAAAVGGADVERDPGDMERGLAGRPRQAEEGRRRRKGRRGRHHVRSAKRNTAAATAHVQRPAGSPTAAAVMEVLPKMRLLV